MRLNEIIRSNRDFGIITSYRPERSTHENEVLFQELKEMLSTYGYHWSLVSGTWANRSEPALLVQDIPLEILRSCMGKYQQDAVIFSGSETEGRVVLLSRTGEFKAVSPNFQ